MGGCAMQITERDALHICGYAVETTAAQSAEDLSRLFEDFFSGGRESVLRKMPGSQTGFYGLMWYTQGHEKYCYLLGVAVGEGCEAPEGAMLRTVPETTYAVAEYPRGKDAVEAWTEFFFTDIPREGYAPNAQLNLYFEFFPERVTGDYALWVPVVKAGG